jgi:hypothetical protein
VSTGVSSGVEVERVVKTGSVLEADSVAMGGVEEMEGLGGSV